MPVTLEGKNGFLTQHFGEDYHKLFLNLTFFVFLYGFLIPGSRVKAYCQVFCDHAELRFFPRSRENLPRMNPW